MPEVGEKEMLTVEAVVSLCANDSASRALTEVVAGLISRKVSRNKHTPESLKHTSAIEKHDIFLEYVFLDAEYTFPGCEYDCSGEEYGFSRKKLEFLLWRFSITALLLGLRHPGEPNSFPTKTAPQGRRNLSMLTILHFAEKRTH